MKSLKNILLLAILALAACNAPKKTQTGATQPAPTEVKPVAKPVLNPVGLTKPELLKPGYTSMADYCQKNVVYPDQAKKNNIQGTVIVSATLDTMGVLTGVKADNDLGYGTAAAAEKVVQSMSPMSPAGNNGKVVRFHIKVPVNFEQPKQFTSDSEEKLEKIYGQMPDVEAQYPGGAAEKNKFIQNNIKLPPSMQTSGTVFVAADIDENGKLSNVRPVKPGIADLDAAAVNVVKAMPNWTPAKTLDHPVKSTVVIDVEMKR